jgi:TolB protein
MNRRLSFALGIGAALLCAPAAAQDASVIAVPPLATPDAPTSQAAGVAWQASQLIASDLRATADLVPVGPNQKDYYSYPEVTAPTFSKWRAQGAKLLLTGFVRSRSDGRLTVGCYVYDVAKGREASRIGFVAAADDWRRAAHKCSGLAYTAATGAPGIFDTRIAYVAETGAGANKVKRIAVMDNDGNNQTYVTAGDTIALTPRLSPKADRLAYVSYLGGLPNVRLADLGSSQQRPLVANGAISFAPRFSPDGTRVLFSMQSGSNIDIYVTAANGSIPQRLTTSPGIDTDGSFSPDGTKIVFESDRGGSQQLYVMNADGSGQRRISFGGGGYAAPDWSPDGASIAFTRRGPEGLRIGVIASDGSGEKLLTTGPGDEGPSWGASGRDIVFQRTEASGVTALYRVSLSGGQPRKVETPQPGSDPDWSGVLD